MPEWGKSILRGANVGLGRQKYTKYNKTSNNSENFRGQDCCWEGGNVSSPLSCQAKMKKIADK